MATTGAPRWVLVLFLLVGVLIAAFGATILRNASTVPDGWVAVEGVVVGHEEHRDSDSTTWAPVVEYRDAAGATHRVVSGVSSSFRDAVGSTIEVAYDPDDPGRARITGGFASMAWLIVVGFGVLFALLPGVILLAGLRGGSAREPLAARVIAESATGAASASVAASPTVGAAAADVAPSASPTGRLRIERSRAGDAIQLVVMPLGGVGFLVFASFLLSRGLPDALFALLAGFFGIMLLLGGIAAVARMRDPRAIEIGPDGVWLPGLGGRRWDEFADIRLETYTGPAGGGRAGGQARVASYRRLGFVPRDPELAGRRGIAERLSGGMGVGYYRLASRLIGREPVDLAPFGVGESEIGHEAFERLLEAVNERRAVGEATERPSDQPSPLAGAIGRGDDEAGAWSDPSTDASIDGGGAAGFALDMALFFLPLRWRRRAWFAEIGFFVGLVAGVFGSQFGAIFLSGGLQPPALVFVAILALIAGTLGGPAIRAARRASERGESLGAIVGLFVSGALVGLIVAGVFVSGFAAPPPTR